MIIKGQGVSKGYGIGKLVIYDNNIVVPSYHVEDTHSEINRFKDSVITCETVLNQIYQRTKASLGEDKAQLFKAHEMMLNDPEFQKSIIENISNHMNAEFAVKSSSQVFEEMFLAMENDYFKERASDIKDISNRLIYSLLNIELTDLSGLEKGTILVARDLVPSDTSQLIKENIVGIVTEIGGDTSHSAIIARTLGIPAVMGIGDAFNELQSSFQAIIDGEGGSLYLNPSDALIHTYERKSNERRNFLEGLCEYKDKEFTYANDKKIEIAGNIALPSEAANVLDNGGEGIGLFRSEFLFMNRSTPPSEDEQYEAYKKALEIMGDHPVTIRTMDIGGDKAVDYLNIGNEDNPFLGYRAIRYCFDNLEFFKTQLRALYRASVHGKLRIMFPMISNVNEVIKIKSIIDDVKKELDVKEIEYNHVEIGVMIEVPSAALMSDVIARHVDFASIGTNDLTQYTLACDRMNPKVKDIYSNYDPAVIKLIHLTISNFHKENKWVGMCGSAAGNIDLMAVWHAMKLDEFSMVSNAIPEAKFRMNQLKNSKLSLDHLLSLSTKEEVVDYLHNSN